MNNRKIQEAYLKKLIKEEVANAQKKIFLERKLREIALEQALISEGILEEGFKDWLVGILMSAAGLAGAKAQTPVDLEKSLQDLKVPQDKIEMVLNAVEKPETQKFLKDYGIEYNNIEGTIEKLQTAQDNLSNKDYKVTPTRIHTVQTAEKAIEYLNMGWMLTDVQVKQVADTLIQYAPDSLVTSFKIDFNNEKLFGAGKWDVSSVPQLQQMIDSVKKEGAIIMSIHIESSTDKQRVSEKTADALENAGYDGNNEGLSYARNNSIKNYLIELGVNSKIIHQGIKWEQGAGQVGAVTEQDPSARYVRVVFDVVKYESPSSSKDTKITTKDVTSYSFIKFSTPFKDSNPFPGAKGCFKIKIGNWDPTINHCVLMR